MLGYGWACAHLLPSAAHSILFSYFILTLREVHPMRLLALLLPTKNYCCTLMSPLLHTEVPLVIQSQCTSMVHP